MLSRAAIYHTFKRKLRTRGLLFFPAYATITVPTGSNAGCCRFGLTFFSRRLLPPQCRDALTVRQKLISQDYRVSYSLAKACKLDLRKQRCSLDTSLPRAREARLSYLLLCLEAAVHRGEKPQTGCSSTLASRRQLVIFIFVI